MSFFIRCIKNCFSIITGQGLKLQKTDVITPMVCLSKEFYKVHCFLLISD